jgi:xylulose-5-phosphate/fructose-6-phosphate phosphoketolase
MSRYHLAAEAVRRVPRLQAEAPRLIAQCTQQIETAVAYSQEHFEDMPEIRDWTWADPV